jgi:3-deoxy-manno-octulosonate cytidylyltransferase (CMP-KDO synthetase)
MTKIAIIIPSRLNAQRLPNKPLKLIKNKEMIQHVYDLAIKAQAGNVVVATPDQQIIEIIKNNGGSAVKTKYDHQTGTDRVYEVFEKEFHKEVDFVINLQGDMPNLNPLSINDLINHMKKNTCDIGTLASNLDLKNELSDPNICKVVTNRSIHDTQYASALDFYRSSDNVNSNPIYHHIGIYAFTSKALIRYVSLKRSKLEVERKLEQMRALENEMKIDVLFTNDCPLSVDTEKDLVEIKKIMETDEKN